MVPCRFFFNEGFEKQSLCLMDFLKKENDAQVRSFRLVIL